MPTIAVLGANGTIGSTIVREALDRGHTVTAIVRNPESVTVKHPNLQVTTGDALDPNSIAKAAAGHDVLVSAVGGGDGPGHTATIKPTAQALVHAARDLDDAAPRLLTVGGAGSLRTADGAQVWDTPGLPDWMLEIMHAHGDALDYLRNVTDVEWVNVSPAATIAPGDRTGTYRTAKDDLILDAQGDSAISVEDFALAMVDEIERPLHRNERFAVAN